MGHTSSATTVPKTSHGSFTSYSVGFMLSIILTIVAYFMVVNKVFTGSVLVAALIALAMAQLLVQLLFFLHLGTESKPRWNLLIFLFMVLVVSIVAFGSLWIMHNLDYNMMSPAQMDLYMHENEGL